MLKYGYDIITQYDPKNENFLDKDQVVKCVEEFYKVNMTEVATTEAATTEINDEQIRIEVEGMWPQITNSKILTYQETLLLIAKMDLLKNAEAVSRKSYM